MQSVQNPTVQAHENLRNLLLNGRILINGFPPTAAEMGGIIQGEQMLFEKASRLDAAQELAAKVKEPKDSKKKSNIVPIREPENK